MILKKLAPIVFVIASTGNLIGCAEQSSTDSAKKAELAIAGKKYQEAEVFLKNAVSSDLDNQYLNLQLANVYYFQGKFNNALKQYEKISNEDVLTPESIHYWLQSLLFNEDIAGIKAVVSKYQDTIAAPVFNYYSQKVNLPRIQSQNNANQQEASSLGKLVSCISDDGSENVTRTKCLRALIPPKEPEPLYELAKHSIKENELDAFLFAISSLSSIFPESELFQIVHAEALVRSGLLDEGSSVLVPLLTKYPEQPLVNYLKSVIEFENKNFSVSKLTSEKALQNGLNNNNARLIAALSAYYLQDFEQAYNHFRFVIGDINKSSPEYRIYTSTLLALGYTSEAAVAIKSIESVSVEDLPLVSSTANVLASINESSEAISLLGLFDEIVDGESEAYVKLNLQKLALDDVSALSNLEALNSTESDTSVKVGLASYYLSQNDFKKALAIAEELRRNEGERYTSKVIEALVAYHSGDEGVQQKFNTLFEYDEYSLPALFFFANFDLENNESEKALVSSKKLLQIIPESILAISTHARILSAMGNRKLLLDFLSDVSKSSADDPNLAALYAAEVLKDGMVEKSLSILSGFNLTINNKPLFWVTLINASFLSGDTVGAKKIALEWLTLVPNYKPAFMLAANLHEKQGDLNGSINLLKRAEKKFPRDDKIKLLLASNYLNNGSVTIAKQKIKELSRETKSSISFLLVDGQVDLIEGEYQSAKEKLGQYFSEYKSYDAFLLLVTVLKKLDEMSEAALLAEQYLDYNGFDDRVSVFLAELYIQLDHKKAIKLYEKIIENGVKSASALNNLAWLYHVNDESKKGVKYAEMAVEMDENNAEYKDTLGMIRLRLGDAPRALTLLQSAFRLAPGNILIALHYAEALVVSEQKGKAEIVLSPYLNRSRKLDEEIERVLEVGL